MKKSCNRKPNSFEKAERCYLLKAASSLGARTAAAGSTTAHLWVASKCTLESDASPWLILMGVI